MVGGDAHGENSSLAPWSGTSSSELKAASSSMISRSLARYEVAHLEM